MASGSRSIHAGSDEIFQNKCDVCLTQKRTSEAKSYCTVCDEHLCQRCEQAHKGSKASKNHTILTGSSIPSGSSQPSSLTDQITSHTKPTTTSLLNMIVSDKKEEIDLGSEFVFGCTFMPDGHLVVTCDSDGLKLFDRTFKYKSQISVISGDVAVCSANDVLVTQGGDKQLQRVQVLPTMVVKNTIKMDRKCYGVDVSGAKIYTTCHGYPGNGEVRVMDMAGTTQRSFGEGKYTCTFKRPEHVKVSRDGSKLFVSDWGTHIVTCLNQHGHEIYRYSDSDLEKPIGMYVDGEDNLLVCGRNSYNVHVVRHDGKREKILLTQKDGLWGPAGISYRQSDGCLAVVMGQGKDKTKLAVFATKI